VPLEHERDARAYTYLSLRHGYIALRIGGPNVIRAGADQAIVVELLDDVSGPTADSRDGEDGGKQIYVNSQGVVGGCGVEIHIGVELFLSLHKFFDLAGHLEPLALATAFPQIAGHFAQVRGPRVFGVIDAMAESRNFLFLRQHALDVIHGINSGLIDGLKNMKHSLIRAAVQRPFQGADGRGHS
jgi:hypothetical protein